MEYVQIDASSVWFALFPNKRLDCSHRGWNIYWRLSEWGGMALGVGLEVNGVD